MFLGMAAVIVFAVGEFDLSISATMGLAADRSCRCSSSTTAGDTAGVHRRRGRGDGRRGAQRGHRRAAGHRRDHHDARHEHARGRADLGVRRAPRRSPASARRSPASPTQHIVLGLPISFFYGVALARPDRLRDALHRARDATWRSSAQTARSPGWPACGSRAFAWARYVTSGFLCGVGGVLLAATVGGFDPNSSPTYLLPALSATFLGTAAIKAGRFNPIGTMVAIYFLVTGIVGLELLGYTGWVSDVFYGAALIIAVVISTVARRRTWGPDSTLDRPFRMGAPARAGEWASNHRQERSREMQGPTHDTRRRRRGRVAAGRWRRSAATAAGAARPRSRHVEAAAGSPTRRQQLAKYSGPQNKSLAPRDRRSRRKQEAQRDDASGTSRSSSRRRASPRTPRRWRKPLALAGATLHVCDAAPTPPGRRRASTRRSPRTRRGSSPTRSTTRSPRRPSRRRSTRTSRSSPPKRQLRRVPRTPTSLRCRPACRSRRRSAPTGSSPTRPARRTCSTRPTTPMTARSRRTRSRASSRSTAPAASDVVTRSATSRSTALDGGQAAMTSTRHQLRLRRL